MALKDFLQVDSGKRHGLAIREQQRALEAISVHQVNQVLVVSQQILQVITALNRAYP